MLLRLAVRGFGLLSDVTLEFAPGLNVLTGETGAGKSMVLSALALLAGAAVPRDFAPAELEAELDLSHLTPARRAELHLPGGTVRVARVLLGKSRSRALVEGQGVPLARLRAILEEAISLSAQNAVREIASRSGVLQVLDARAGATELAASVRRALVELARTQQELAELSGAISRGRLERDGLVSLVEELDALAPRRGEHAELAQRIELQSRAQDYLELAQRVTLAVFERETPIERELSALLQQVRRAPALPVLERLAEAIGGAITALAEAGREAARLAEELGFESGDLARTEQRFEALTRLAARAAVEPDRLSEHAETLQRRLWELELAEQRRDALESSFRAARDNAARLAAELHERRLLALPALQAELEREVSALALPNARLHLGLERRQDETALPAASALTIGFSANPGEPLLPLTRVASGGERSRVALALCCVGVAPGLTLVFDEIDQGVGGEAVLAVAERMQRLASTQQILCVTHQAAIAARADAHFLVRKSFKEERTCATVERLDDEQRTSELSRMLAGGRALTASRTLARRLLEAAHRAA